MKIGGKHILMSYKPLGYVQSPIGQLAVFSISLGDTEKVWGHTGLQPKEFVYRLLPFILHKASNIQSDGEKPEAPTLTDEDVRRLPDPVVEEVLDIFIASQEHLYKKCISQVKTNEADERIHSMSYGDVEHPKQPGESNVDYIHRLYVLEREELKRQMSKLVSPFLNAAHFSPSLNESIKNTLLMGNSMSKALEAMRPPAMPDLDGFTQRPVKITPSLPSSDYAALAKSAEEARWAPFNAVNERLDTLVDISAASSKFMVQMNQTQTAIASEIKASGEESSRIGRDSLKVTRWGFYATIAVFILTILGLVLSVIDRRTGGGDSEFFRQRAEQFTTGLDGLAKAMAADRSAAAADLKTVLTQIEQARSAQESQIRAILTNQAELIRRQEQDRIRDQKTIEALERKLAELEAKIDGHRPAPQPEPQTQPAKGNE